MSQLTTWLAEETAGPVPAEVSALYQSFCASLPHPQAVVAGLFYGSGLWKEPAADNLWDLYVLVDRYADAITPPLLRVAAALLPPTVYYHETSVARGKIAVMTMRQFTAHCAGQSAAPQTWARFAQPCRLIASRDAAARQQVMAALTQAVRSFHRATAVWVSAPCDVATFWRTGLAHTYGSEWRSERHGRLDVLVQHSLAALHARTRHIVAETNAWRLDGEHVLSPPIRWRLWRQWLQRGRNMLGKLLHVLRLIKAAFTFAAGLEYISGKILRHSGVDLQPSAWQRRHPLLAALPLFVRGWRARAFR